MLTLAGIIAAALAAYAISKTLNGERSQKSVAIASSVSWLLVMVTVYVSPSVVFTGILALTLLVITTLNVAMLVEYLNLHRMANIALLLNAIAVMVLSLTYSVVTLPAMMVIAVFLFAFGKSAIQDVLRLKNFNMDQGVYND